MSFLDPNQSAHLMQRFPTFELSYEIVSHKKVNNNYNTCLAIPYGKKAFLWMTYFRDTDVCFLMELGRDNKVGRIQIVSNKKTIPCNLAYGTLLYGTIYKENENEKENKKIGFIVEDFLFYCGISIAKLIFSDKLGFLERFFCEFSDTLSKSIDVNIALPAMWKFDALSSSQIIPNQWSDNRIPYTIHHFQYRSLTKIVPYINIKPTKDLIRPLDSHSSLSMTDKDLNTVSSQFSDLEETKNTNTKEDVSFADIFIPPKTPQYDFRKPQYNERTLFEISADRYADIYHLHAYASAYTNANANANVNKNREYYGLAYIPNYKTSVFMNSIFRNIKENQNLDSIEESDDEDDFQDTTVDKYVDLNKRVIMECVFQPKFKRWIPVNIANPRSRIVPIHRLVRSCNTRGIL